MQYIALGVALLLIAIGLMTVVRRRQSSGNATHRESPDAIPQPASDREAANSFENRFDLAELCKRLGKTSDELSAHHPEYREQFISKSHGGKRRLEIPDDVTKELQRCILKRLLQACECHPMACAFEEGASIVDAALPHQGRAVIVKMDIRQFFESTTEERVRRWWQSIGWSAEAATILVKLTTHAGHLPQGAPTSPRLSNLINASLDHALLLIARKHKGRYSRYADDITMSFDLKRGRPIRGIIQKVRRVLRSYGYTMHGGRKLRILRQHQQQRVLGLVVNERAALPRKTRRWLRAVRHKMETGGTASLTPEQLRGWESYSSMIETQRNDREGD